LAAPIWCAKIGPKIDWLEILGEILGEIGNFIKKFFANKINNKSKID